MIPFSTEPGSTKKTESGRSRDISNKSAQEQSCADQRRGGHVKTKQEAEAWIKSLKPGDKIIQVETGWGSEKGSPMAALTVKKVTATGIVRTEEGHSFQQNRYMSTAHIAGYGGTHGAVVPYDDTLAEKAEASGDDRLAGKYRGKARAQEAIVDKNQKLADEDDRKRAEKKLAKEAKKTNA